MVTKTKKVKIKSKSCYFTEIGKEPDYKDVLVLKRFLTDRQKVMHHAYSGLSAKNQRKLSKAVKRARYMALIPYTDKHDI
ncbi:30S ribosomal protein S18 [candidate division WWE3 bacterium RBG_19FT_COMBO_34_6]|uniref:Small ribosomal subunit protein bS18 n=1 Tax=candidate division WWE3 bacterium RBG_19FT_COMBO_34_6 TaxID=1802612 RepID=A0A1F4UMW4_UNCKA|nr:MAG: 30S ribosomal protein S18 [candidate division WWE3 bacterium RBG_19FT_COMBO_34_6]